MISLRNVRAGLARLISTPGLPAVSFPDAGTGAPSAMRIVAQAAPVASVGGMPRTTLAELGIRLTPEIMADAVVRHQANHRNQPAAGLRGRATPARPAPRAIAPASLDDEGSPQKSEPVDYSKIISTLEGIVEDLKAKVPVDAAEEADEASARAAAKSGRQIDAVKGFADLAQRLQAKVAGRSAVRSEKPDGHKRAHRLISGGFNEQPAVAALNSMLNRSATASLATGRTRIPDRPVAVAQQSTLPTDRTVYRSLMAQRADLNYKARKSGVFHQAFLAEDAKIKAAIDREAWKVLNRQ